MDMARRIIEGIHEVELKVTPEFRKHSPLEELEAALKENGWEEFSGAPHGVSTIVRTWVHPYLADADVDASIKVTYDWKTNELVKNTILVQVGAEKPVSYPATPKVVKTLTDELKTETAERGASAGWGEPKRLSWSGQPRLDYEWKGKALVRGVRAEAHPSRVYAVSWPKSSVGLKGYWGDALRAIKKFDGWDKVYVYGVDDQVGANEFNKLIMEGVVEAWFVPNETGASEYDGNVADMLGEYIGHAEKPGGEAQ